MLEAGPITAGLIGVGSFALALGLLGAVMCLILRIPIRGSVFNDPTEAPQGLAFRGLARFAVVGSALWAGATVAFLLGI